MSEWDRALQALTIFALFLLLVVAFIIYTGGA